MVYEVTYKKNEVIWVGRMGFQYLCDLEKDPTVEILSIK